MSKYNVLFISNESELGGAATSLIDMIKGLKRKGIKCVVIIPAKGMIEERLQELEVLYYIVYFTTGYGPIGIKNQEDEDLNFYDNYKAAVQLQDIIKKENIQLVHINSSVSNVGAFAALMAGVPYVWHFRELLEEHFDCEFWDKQLKLELINRCNCIISVSKTVQDSCQKKYNVNSFCIYNGVDAERYRKNIVWQDGECHNFIITGVINPNKGQWDAVKAIDILIKRGVKNIHLSLLGQSSGRTAWIMKQFICENNLEEYITIVPFQKNLKKYREGSVYSITTSKMEALGRCTIEAMLAGNVVIGADTGGTFEIIGDDNTRGYLYKQGDYVSLADTMYQAITDSEDVKKRYLENAQKYAEETFSVDKYSDNIIEVYDTVLKQTVKGNFLMEHRALLENLEKRFQTLEYFNSKASKKRNTFSEIQQTWRRLQERGIYIKDYFIQNNLCNIAIYGMGNLGCQFYDEIISDDMLQVKYVIDRNDTEIGEYIKITKPDEALENIDILVVAMASGEQDIIDYYKGNGYRVVSIAEILDRLQEEICRSDILGEKGYVAR